MNSLANELSNLSTTDTLSSANLDQLPEDIIQLVISFLQIESPGRTHNTSLAWVEKDAQDIVFQRAAWNHDLDTLAKVSRRLREETFYRTRMRVMRVKDTEEDIKRTSKVIPVSKRHYVHAIIFGNFRMTEGVAKSPDYLSFCATFPHLRAIRHTTSYDFYIVDHVPNPPFRFHSLDSLDVHLPSALLEDIPGDIPVEPVSVNSLTLRSHEEFMLHLPGPFTDSEPDWLHNVIRQVKDVQQLNLHTGLEDDADRWSPYYNNLPSHDPFPGFRKEDFPDLQELNVYFTTRYRSDEENPCDLQRFTHFLTHFAPTIRHIRFFVQYPDPVDIIEYIRELPPGVLPHDRSLLALINRYFPTLEQIDTFLTKIADAIPALQTFDMKFDDERAHPPPLIHYSASIQREEKGSGVVPVITKHVRAVDGESMAWLVDSAAELMGIGMNPAGMGLGGVWGDDLDEEDDAEFADDFFDEAAVDEVWDM